MQASAAALAPQKSSHIIFAKLSIAITTTAPTAATTAATTTFNKTFAGESCNFNFVSHLFSSMIHLVSGILEMELTNF